MKEATTGGTTAPASEPEAKKAMTTQLRTVTRDARLGDILKRKNDPDAAVASMVRQWWAISLHELSYAARITEMEAELNNLREGVQQSIGGKAAIEKSLLTALYGDAPTPAPGTSPGGGDGGGGAR